MVEDNSNNCLYSNTWLSDDSQREYGSHTPTFSDNLREKICIFCSQRKPTSLEELTISVILENAGLIKGVDTALSHLPHRICWLVGRLLNANLTALAWRLLPFVAEYGDNRDSWFEVDDSMEWWLKRFRLACEVHQKLKPYSTCPSVGISKILQYHSSIDSDYEEFWKSMYSAVKEMQGEAENGCCLEPLKSVASTSEERKNVVLVPLELTADNPITESEFQSMKALQRLNKTFATPIVFKPTDFFLPLDLESDEITHLLEDFDTEVISSVDIRKETWSVEDLDQLGVVLSTCTKLTDIYLRQVELNEEEIVNVAPAISRLLSHHSHLVKIGLKGFELAGTFAEFPLPPVENLRLCLCTFTDEDWNFMANRSDLAIKTLVVSSNFEDHFPSLCSFLLSQAPTLEMLGLEFSILTVEEICKTLRIMARFNKLSSLELICMEDPDYAIIEKITIDIMSIHSSRKLLFDFPTPADAIDITAEATRLDEAITRSCKANRRPPLRVTIKFP